MSEDVRRRKEQHLTLAATGDVAARVDAGFDGVTLVHDALPELAFDAVDTSCRFLGHRLALPLVIASMTGGHPMALEVNRTLARVTARQGLAMGVGSQRAALLDPEVADSYAVVRREAPDAFLIANIGASQLVPQAGEPALTLEDVRRAVGMIRADALAVHLNALQEVVQPEGQTNAIGWLEAIGRLVEQLDVPVIAKETGAGISGPVARRLVEVGVAAIDVSGLGGTTFAAVEAIRAEERGDLRRAALGHTLREWGIPTAASILLARGAGVPLIATGGIASGLDAAKALALGASIAGVARPALQRALDGEAALDEWVERFALELRAAMFLTGSATPDRLRRAPHLLSPALRAWTAPLSADG
jgi:isopentenyl-diphosphate delta-isomerase